MSTSTVKKMRHVKESSEMATKEGTLSSTNENAHNITIDNGDEQEEQEEEQDKQESIDDDFDDYIIDIENVDDDVVRNKFYEESYDEEEDASEDKGANKGVKEDGDDTKQGCVFQKPSPSSSIPLILMSLGRAGSSVTWDTLSTMLGSTTKAHEITGGNRPKALNFFDELAKTEDGANWPIQRICQIQQFNTQKYINPVITGFQWKPYRVTLNHEMGQAGLDSIAKHKHPSIKVLFLSRNPLDRLISNLRHRATDLSAHCAVGDEECIKNHEKHAKGITLPTGHELIHSMNDGERIDKLTRYNLLLHEVQHLAVSYENLYLNDGDVSEWIRIFKFLGRSPKNVEDFETNMTMKHVEEAFAIAPTHAKGHEEMIANYDEVKKDLVKAGLEYLLH